MLPLRDVDNGHGVAWLSPTTFVLLARGKLRLFLYGCIYRGSKLVYSGRGVDTDLVDEGAWPLVPLGDDRVLVMHALPASATRDEAGVMRANEHPLHWAVLDLRTRRLARTRLVFGEQGWVYLQPERLFRQAPGPNSCAGFTERPS